MDREAAFEVASRRCFTTPEIVNLLSPNTTPLSLSTGPPESPPPSGSLFLYDRFSVTDYKQDGHDWVMKPVSSKNGGSRVREDSARLKIGEHCRVAAYYARSAIGGGTMRRRSYRLIDPTSLKPRNNLVLIHYLDTGKHEVRQRRDAPNTDKITHETDDAEKRRGQALGLVELERKNRSGSRPPPGPMDDGASCHGDFLRRDILQSTSAPGKLSSQQRNCLAVSEFLSAPKTTEECMAKEWESSSDADRSAVICDLYGMAVTTDDPKQSLDWNFSSIFTNELQGELLMSKLSLMDNEIEKMPANSKLCYLAAMQLCPHLVAPRDFKLQFLRCECFDPRAAARRLVKYWDKRVQILGRNGAFLPLTLAGTMANDHEVPGFGFFKLLPGLDVSGRAVILLDNSIQSCTPMTAMRSMWYMLHAALENESVKRQGVVSIIFRRPSPEVLDLQCRMELQSLIRDIIPLQLRACHLCHWKTNDLSGWFVNQVISAIAFSAGPYVRSRFVFHDGSKEKVLIQLAEYGIASRQLPTKLGGTFTDEDFQQWLVLRREAGM